MTRLPDVGIRPTVPDLLRYGSQHFADNDFIVMNDRRVTFAEADRYSSDLAKRMLASGVGKGTRVGIVLPSSTQFAIAFLAVTRIGALAVPLSSLYRPVELERSLRLADAQHLIAPERMFGKDYSANLEEAVPGLATTSAPFHLPAMPSLRSIWLDSAARDAGDDFTLGDHKWADRVTIHPLGAAAQPDWDSGEIDDEFLHAVEASVFPADPLVMIWTSGSEADPKGVVHTHGVVVRKVSPQIGLGSKNSVPGRVLNVGPMFWVAGPQAILGALYCGSAVICQERFDATEAVELIERERCTAAAGWPTMYERLYADPEWQRRDTSSLLPVAPPPVSSKGDPRNFGMTETFGPHGNRELFDYKVIDPDTGRELEDLQEGEFCIRGFGMMSVMYKREREEVFDADGFYHTGDRGYIEDGYIYFTGRYKEIIKSAGANVAPPEVEAALLSIPDVRSAVVFGVPSAERGEEVVAVVAPQPGATLDPAEVRAHSRRLLSAYKVPSQVHVRDIDDIPLLASGKVDKRALKGSLLE